MRASNCVSDRALTPHGLSNVVDDVRDAQVGSRVERGDPEAVPVEDPHVRGVEVGVAGLRGGEHMEPLPDGFHSGHGRDEVVELAERSSFGEEPSYVGGCVDAGMHADRERDDLTMLGSKVGSLLMPGGSLPR